MRFRQSVENRNSRGGNQTSRRKLNAWGVLASYNVYPSDVKIIKRPGSNLDVNQHST